MTVHRICTRKFDHVSVQNPCPSRTVRAASLLSRAACKTEDQNIFILDGCFEAWQVGF